MIFNIRHHVNLNRAALAIVVAAAVGALSLSAPAVTAASHDDGAHATTPTVVLVHGGWADASSWNQEVTNLEERGLPTLAPANPLRGLQSDADYIQSVLQTIDGPIVLVGHSYGGAVITNAAVRVQNVKALVYIAAFAPDTGESLAQLEAMNPGTQIVPEALTARAHATTVQVNSSHVAMISQPEATTRLILEAVRSIR